MRSRSVPLALLIVLLAAPWLGGDAQAQYTARVPVADRSEGGWYAGVRDALREVLIQLTGDPALVDGPELAPLLESSTDFMQESAFEPSGGSPSGYALVVRFDPQRVDRALAAARPAPRPRELPPTLVWLAVETGVGPRLVASDTDPGLRRALDRAAEARGAALLYPLLDLEDRQTISAQRVWQGDDASVRRASARYGTDSLLLGRVRRADPDGWSVDWTHLLRGAPTQTETQGPTVEAALESGVAWMAARLRGGAKAAGGARGGSVDGTVLVVEQVRTVEDYARVSSYLRGVDLLAGAALTQVEPDRLRFQTPSRVGHEGLVQALSAGGRLVPVGPGGVGEEGALHFRLLP